MNDIQERLLGNIRDLAPDLIRRIAEIEAARRIPPDLVQALKGTGLFRMFVPRSHGGLELDLPAGLDVVAALAKIDGSLGWIGAIGAVSALFAAFLPRVLYEQFYRNGPDAVLAGSGQPVGTAEATDRGWRVNGRWPFASGCQHADWIMAGCVMTEGGKPIPGPTGDGAPALSRIFILPARDWQIEDNWYAAGLKGTGSHHIALTDIVVPEANFFDLPNGPSSVPGPLYQGLWQVNPLAHAAVAVGMAEGALSELIALADSGRQQLRAPALMRDSELFQVELGRIAADVRAARAFLEVEVANHWRHALAGTLKSDEEATIRAIQTGVWITTTCVRVADACFQLGGASVVYDTSPLQRRLRDLHVAAQHAAVQQRQYVAAGKMLLHRPTPDTEAPAT